MSKLKITQIRSAINCPKTVKLTIEALGLGRTNYFNIVEDSAAIRGQIRKVSHLVKVEEAK